MQAVIMWGDLLSCLWHTIVPKAEDDYTFLQLIATYKKNMALFDSTTKSPKPKTINPKQLLSSQSC